MKLKKSEIMSFLTGVMLSGEIEVKEVVLKIQKDCITANAVSSNKVVALRGKLTGTFEDIGDVGIDSLPAFCDILDLFKTEIDVTVKTNKIVLKEGSLKANVTLRNPQYISNGITDQKFEDLLSKLAAEPSFILEPKDIQKISSYLSTIKSTEITLIGSKDLISVSSKSQNDEILDDMPIKFDGTFNVKLGKVVVDLFAVTTTPITITAKEPNPVSIVLKNGNTEISYLVAPLK